MLREICGKAGQLPVVEIAGTSTGSERSHCLEDGERGANAQFVRQDSERPCRSCIAAECERPEKTAGFTLEEMKQKLLLKQKNQCTCAAGDILCKTMCGTLLGPSAKDHK